MKDIFISYKRLGASKATATYIYDFLTKKGYSVFLDRHEIKQGEFDVQLYRYIESAKDVIILLEENSLASCYQDNKAYTEDWFCKEIMYAIEKQKRIVPLLLDGYKMPDEKDLPVEMMLLTKQNALSFDSIEIEDFYKKYFVEQGYLSAKPSNYYLSSFEGDGIADFLFYSNADCDVYEFGKLVAVLDQYSSGFDEENPFVLPVKRSGEHRFRVVNHDTCEELVLKEEILKDSQKYVEVKWANTKSLWNLTKEDIASSDISFDILYKYGKGLYKGNSKHAPNYELALECLKRSADNGEFQSKKFLCDAVKDVYSKWCNGELTEACVDEWLDLSIEYKSENGYYLKASKLFDGKDYNTARKYYELCAELYGNADADNMLGLMYKEGLGVEEDVEKSILYFGKAAKKGNAYAQGNLGLFYFEGVGVEQDYYKAKDWFIKAAEQGNYSAMCSLGTIYFYGCCGIQDYTKAYNYYIKSADARDPLLPDVKGEGYPQAQHTLGFMYYMGLGVKEDKTKAYEWFLKAGRQELPQSQFWIGAMHLKGEVVERNVQEAYFWFGKSSSNGFYVSLIMLNSISSSEELSLSKEEKTQIKESYASMLSEFEDDYKLEIIDSLNMAGFYNEAVALVDTLQNIGSADYYYKEIVGDVLVGAGRCQEALSLYEEYSNYLKSHEYIDYEQLDILKNKIEKLRKS